MCILRILCFTAEENITGAIKMTLRILIAECDPPEEALALLKGAGETAADAFARALRPLADTQPLFPLVF